MKNLEVIKIKVAVKTKNSADWMSSAMYKVKKECEKFMSREDMTTRVVICRECEDE